VLYFKRAHLDFLNTARLDFLNAVAHLNFFSQNFFSYIRGRYIF
jgi:hypothetical protein